MKKLTLMVKQIWVDRYLLENSIKRHNRLPISYTVKKKHVKYAIKKLKENEQITMSELTKIVKKNQKFRRKDIKTNIVCMLVGKTFIKIVRQTNDSLALLALRMGDGFFNVFFLQLFLIFYHCF